MSASENLQHEQLRMFMSPNELGAAGYTMNPSDIETVDRSNARSTGYSPQHAMERRKAREASDSGLFGEIAKNGVEHPLGLYTGDPIIRREGLPNWSGRVIANGGHRFAAQRLLNPERLMPVLHGDTAHSAIWSGERMHESTYWKGASERYPDGGII